MATRNELEDNLYKALKEYLQFHLIHTELDHSSSGQRNLEVKTGGKTDPLTLGVMVEVYNTRTGNNDILTLEDVVKLDLEEDVDDEI